VQEITEAYCAQASPAIAGLACASAQHCCLDAGHHGAIGVVEPGAGHEEPIAVVQVVHVGFN